MNTSGDAAESIVRMSLQGTEVALKLTGSAAKNIAALLYAIYKDKKQTKGKTTLTNMLKSGKELKVFSVKQEDLKTFQQQAKRYGVLYTALINKQNRNFDGLVDIMVRAEDASKINRIVKRFDLGTYDGATIKSDVVKSREENSVKDMGVEDKSAEDKLVDELLATPIQKEENEVSNPNVAKMEKSPLSEHLSENKNKSEMGTNSTQKPSVREEIKNIKKELNEKVELDKTDNKKDMSKKVVEHKQPNSKKKKSKERR